MEKEKEEKMRPADPKNAKVFFSQRAVVYDRETQKYLLCKEKSFDPKAGSWQFPGGRLDIDESLEEGFDREMSEELGVSVMYEKNYIILLIIRY